MFVLLLSEKGRGMGPNQVRFPSTDKMLARTGGRANLQTGGRGTLE